ncbi:hypothetical protein J1614_009307 [Plenodomus biglobosus]|nr:hypothetical protein J1614_009307 [Plenodomus biglobosus]
MKAPMAAHIRKSAFPLRSLGWTSSVRYVRYSRCIATDSRNRLSKFWAPTGGISAQDGEQDDSHGLLVRGGFLRQAHSGVFHLLPLGLRVQSKLEALIDKHMSSISASKVSLSSITTEALWRQSGRYSANSELLQIKDRKESGFLLSPTHEEEITALVASMVHSYKDLPLRLYQIGRKYRDERRPRQGLLRAKEFMMKDLYTFDADADAALQTYQEVRQAYNNLFDELRLPYLVADADSGNMGGKLSHEYHFASPKGEDNVWTCNSCSYVANEELVEKKPTTSEPDNNTEAIVFTGISTDHTTAINIHIPRPSSLPPASHPSWTQISSYINLHAVKRALPSSLDLDAGIQDPTLTSLLSKTTSQISLYDATLPQPTTITTTTTSSSQATPTHLTTTHPGDPCPRCPTGTLTPHRAIEIAHTFHLGTRYSLPLSALIAPADTTTNAKLPIQMGCHGIGISRIIGAVAALLCDGRGLNWPRAIAPFEVVLVGGKGVDAAEMERVYDCLLWGARGRGCASGNASANASANNHHANLNPDPDVILDDRHTKSLGWKLQDADLIGYPVIVVVGRAWKERAQVEVQCRRLGVKKDVGLGELRGVVLEMLGRL